MRDRISTVLALLMARRDLGIPATPTSVVHTLSYLANVVGPIYRRLHPGFTFVRTHYRAAAFEVVEALDFLYWSGLIERLGEDACVQVTDAAVAMFDDLKGAVGDLRQFTRDIVFTLAAVGASDDRVLGQLLFEEPGFRSTLWKAPKDDEQHLSNDSFFGMPPATRVQAILDRAAQEMLDSDEQSVLRRSVLRAFLDHLVRQAHTDAAARPGGQQ
jgi:hypothetical protein